jgi:hypothetical protein
MPSKATPDPLTDEQIIQTLAALLQVYLESLVLSRDTNNEFNGSPYDVFLNKNGLRNFFITYCF